MTRSQLQAICDRVGKDRLATLLGWTVRTLNRKLSGQHKITKADELAVRHVVECLPSIRGARPYAE